MNTMGLKRAGLVLLCLLVLCLLLSAAWFTLAHAFHDCSGEGCMVCLHVERVRGLGRMGAVCGAGFAALALLWCGLPSGIFGAESILYAWTPVAVKVRMDR